MLQFSMQCMLYNQLLTSHHYFITIWRFNAPKDSSMWRCH